MVLQQTVGEVMSAPVLTVTAETPLQDAVSLLNDHHVSGLPVVDGEAATGASYDQQSIRWKNSQ